MNAVELIGSGRTAEVFAWTDGRVLKLDRPDWKGLSSLEAAALAIVAAAGAPAPRAHEELVVDGRCGIVLDLVDGPLLSRIIADVPDSSLVADEFVALHCFINGLAAEGLPDLVVGLADGIRASGLSPVLVEELLVLLRDLDDGERRLCHFDLHPGNVIVSSDRWVVIDWMTAASGPPTADFARTLVLDRPGDFSMMSSFMSQVLRRGLEVRRLELERLEHWIRVVAGARLAEGFEGAAAGSLSSLASGRRRIIEVG
jgi:hypothetical protein